MINFYSEGVHESLNVDSKMQFAHQGGVRLSAEEKSAILSFLATLTDYAFLSNPEHSDPFQEK